MSVCVYVCDLQQSDEDFEEAEGHGSINKVSSLSLLPNIQL